MSKLPGWPLTETYMLTRRELETLLHDACWQVWEDVARALPGDDVTSVYRPGAIVESAVAEALDSLFLQATAGRSTPC